MLTGRIHSFETFGSVDGPGVRFVVFMQGCRMRCKYCHNPDSWKINAGEEKTSDEVLKYALRYRNYWGKDGGITVSGGEPLLQIDFVTELFKGAKKEGVHTTIDTAASPFSRDPDFLEKFDELLKYTDLLMVDIKHIDNKAHLDLTKVENTNILDCLKYLDEKGKAVWIRHVLVPGITDIDESLNKLYSFIKTLSNVKRVEILPYHSFGMFKWDALGIKYELKDTPSPDEKSISHAKSLLHTDEFLGYKTNS